MRETPIKPNIQAETDGGFAVTVWMGDEWNPTNIARHVYATEQQARVGDIGDQPGERGMLRRI